MDSGSFTQGRRDPVLIRRSPEVFPLSALDERTLGNPMDPHKFGYKQPFAQGQSLPQVQNKEAVHLGQAYLCFAWVCMHSYIHT